MIGLDRQGWILVGFAVLFVTAIVVSACGWLLVYRGRRPHVAGTAAAEPETPPDEPEVAPTEDEPAEEAPSVEDEPAVEEAPTLPPGNPLR